MFVEGPKSPRWRSEKGCKRIFSRQLINSFSSVDWFLGPVVSSFDFPTKIFGSELEIPCEIFIFPNNPSSRKCNPGHVPCNFTTPCWKSVTKVRSIFLSIPEISIEIIGRRLSLEKFLWNQRVLFWQHYQKFPPQVRYSCWMIKNKQQAVFFSKKILRKSPVDELEAVLELRRKGLSEIESFSA